MKLYPITSHFKGKLVTKFPFEIQPQEENKLPPIEKQPQISKVSQTKLSTSISSRGKPKQRHVHGEDSFQMTKQPPTPIEFIQLIRKAPELHDDFWYCIRKPGGDAYDFEIVNFLVCSKRSNQEYLTISSRGVIHFVNDESTFMTLGEWEREYHLFEKLKKIPFFQKYKKWKNFSIWKNSRRSGMIEQKSTFLKRELFILDQYLRIPLLRVRGFAHQIAQFTLVEMGNEAFKNIDDFNKNQESKRNKVASQLENIEGNIKNTVSNSCQKSLDEFRKEHRISAQKEGEKGKESEYSEAFLVGDSSKKSMYYAQEATIRTHYRRLTKFIRLCDYQIIDAKLTLSMNSTQKVLSSVSQEFKTKVKSQNPLFEVQCSFQGYEILFEPSSQEIQNSIEDAIMKGIAVVCNNELLISAAKFGKYTSPLDEFEEKQFEEDIDLLSVAVNDDQFKKLDEDIKKNVDRAFDFVYSKSKEFMPYLESYNENQNIQYESFQHMDTEKFSQALTKFKEQVTDFARIPDATEIGIFTLNCQLMKSILQPSPANVLKEIQTILPDITFEKMNKMLDEIKQAREKLSQTPVNVDEYIIFRKFLKETEEKMNEYTTLYADIKDFKDLMENNEIKVSDLLLNKFSELYQELQGLRQKIQHAVDSAETHEIAFKRELIQNVENLQKQSLLIAEKLKENALVRDKEAALKNNTSRALEFLSDMGTQVNEFHENSKMYNKYLKELDLEKANFNQVKETKVDYDLKYNLWKALEEWNKNLSIWKDTQFQNIDVEKINEEVDKFYNVALKSRKLQEDGNFVNEVLKEKVESLRNTMPVVSNLRNPALTEKHHWKAINQVLGFEIKVEDPDLTLQYLIDQNVNDKKDEIGEITIKAIKEHELQKMLDSVEEIWKHIDLPVVNHGDKGNEFKLGNLDDVLQQLDDSLVTVNNILSNRYVEPLRHRAVKWHKKLLLLQKTLDE